VVQARILKESGISTRNWGLAELVLPRQCCCPSSGADVFSRHERSSVCLLAGWRVLAWLPGRLSGLHDARRIPAGPPGASARSVRGFVGGPHSGGSKGGRVGGGVKRRDLVQNIEELTPDVRREEDPQAHLCYAPG